MDNSLVDDLSVINIKELELENKFIDLCWLHVFLIIYQRLIKKYR